MNALELLRTDHEKIRGLFGLLAETHDQTQTLILFQELKDMLESYIDFEEEMLFPFFERHVALSSVPIEVLDERYQEIEEIRNLLLDIDIDDDLSVVEESGGENEVDLPGDLFSELRNVTQGHLDAEDEKFLSLLGDSESKESLDRLGEELELARAG